MGDFARCDRCKKWLLRSDLLTDIRLPRHGPTEFCSDCLAIVLEEQTVICDCGVSHILASQWFSQRDRYLFKNQIKTTCPQCKIKNKRAEAHTLNLAIIQAKHHKLPATLTLNEWMETLVYFQGMCAYCLVRPYQVIEHFIPVSRKGPTSRSNCVPACYMCNARKRNKHPHLDAIDMPEDFVERVKKYLSQF